MCLFGGRKAPCPEAHAVTAGALQGGEEDPLVVAYKRHLWVGGVGSPYTTNYQGVGVIGCQVRVASPVCNE